MHPIPKIYKNPAIQQLTMALWSLAASLDFEQLASVKSLSKGLDSI
jgi:hypothetical protein